jgi:hypothetical protein
LDVEQVLTWLKRLAYFDTRVFDEVRTNPNATIPAFVVVSLGIFIAGFGGWLWWMLEDFGDDTDVLLDSAIIGSAIAIVLWGVWLGIVYVMLTQIYRQRVFLEQLLRVMGFASAPIALMGLMFIPIASFGIGLAALGLVFGLTCVAISQVSGASPSQILVSNLAGFFVWAAVLSLFAGGSGGADRRPYAPGIFLYQTIVDIVGDSSDVQETPIVPVE